MGWRHEQDRPGGDQRRAAVRHGSAPARGVSGSHPCRWNADLADGPWHARHGPHRSALAQQIETSQRAENAQMRRWWQQWYGGEVPIPAGAAQGAMPGMGWMAGSRSGMAGMASSLEELKRASDFDRAFIEQMIPHHRMGVMMASHAQWNTRHAELRALQAAMVSAQSREIRQMEQWYRQWYGASAPGTAQPLPQ
jgi:uncharacterized protein (DUF305 family)